MIDILAQEKLSDEINLDFAYPSFEPRAFENNSNNGYKGGQDVYEHLMNLSR
jgi:hypothetical protein